MSGRFIIGTGFLQLTKAERKRLVILGAAGGLFGAGLILSPGLTVGCALIGLVTGLILRYTPSVDRTFVWRALLIALILKVALASLYQSYLFTGGLPLYAPDGDAYSMKGWYISRVFLGKDPAVQPSAEYVFRNYDIEVQEKYSKVLPRFYLYEFGLYTFFLGSIYTAFGYTPLLGRLINIVLSVASAFLIMRVTHDLAGKRGSRAVFLLILFWPSLFLFSLSLLRDPVIVFGIVLVVWSVHRLLRGASLALASVLGGVGLVSLLRWPTGLLLLAILGLWGVWLLPRRLQCVLLVGSVLGLGLGRLSRPLLSITNDPALVFGVVFGVALVVWFVPRLRRGSPLALAGVLGGLGLIGLLHWPVALLLLAILVLWSISHLPHLRAIVFLGAVVGASFPGLIHTESLFKKALVEAYVRHVGYVRSGGVVYSTVPPRLSSMTLNRIRDNISWSDLLRAYPVGVMRYLTEPWPAHLRTLKLKLIFPQMIVWYACGPLAVLGLAALWRRHRDLSKFIISFLAFIISAYGLSEANIGILIRHRDMITPLVLILAVVGAKVVLSWATDPRHRDHSPLLRELE